MTTTNTAIFTIFNKIPELQHDNKQLQSIKKGLLKLDKSLIPVENSYTEIKKIIQTKKEGVVDGSIKMIVDGMSKYDAFGRVLESYYPVVEEVNNKEKFNPDPETHKTTYNYDILDTLSFNYSRI